MIPLIIAIFVLGYACIAMEHKLRVDKAASALLMFGLICNLFSWNKCGDRVAGTHW